MKLFKGLALFAALDASCPNDRWSKVGEACVPSQKWATTCNAAGTLTISAHIDHFYAAVPSTIKTKLLGDLVKKDGWAEGDEDDELKKTVALSFSQLEVNGASVIRGVYTFGPSESATAEAKPTVNNVGLELATPLSYTVTCDYASSIAVKISEVGIDANPTFGGTSTTGSLDIGATLIGADYSSKKWTIGDTVTLYVADNTADSLTVSVAIESCTAYSDKDYLQNAVPISKGTCYEDQINTQILAKIDLHVSALSFDAFKYSSGGNAAYVKCQLRACIVNSDGSRDTACVAAVDANDKQARDAGDLRCLTL
ncbi:unnamed protein product [Oikopleura dioica]|uniref:ZP domain-containing protein n=1 Tax=Oikopleura dioica TaxID=34765 RepID=E4XJK4_OIKDI|nr:unnamed protein product [Oikopleura dioica]CBY35119.1 unnamed protein product [Oikopleura dioica]